MLRKWIPVTVSTCVIILSFAREGHVTKTYYRDVSLDQVVAMADCILRVEKEKQFTSQKEVRIEKDGTLFHLYTLTGFHFKITRVIYSSSKRNVPEAGAPIIVYPAYSSENINLSRLFYLEGIGKSPVYNRYKSSISFENINDMIIFVNRQDDGTFEFCCEYGYESAEMEKEILSIAGKK